MYQSKVNWYIKPEEKEDRSFIGGLDRGKGAQKQEKSEQM